MCGLQQILRSRALVLMPCAREGFEACYTVTAIIYTKLLTQRAAVGLPMCQDGQTFCPDKPKSMWYIWKYAATQALSHRHRITLQQTVCLMGQHGAMLDVHASHSPVLMSETRPISRSLSEQAP